MYNMNESVEEFSYPAGSVFKTNVYIVSIMVVEV